MDKNGETKKQLLTFFTVSLAAFEFQRKITKAFGIEKESEKTSKMISLHEKAAAELKEKNPNMEYISDLLLEMETLAATNA